MREENITNIDEDADIMNIIMILESPHKEEYTEELKAKEIASGRTGKNIDENIVDCLYMNEHITNKKKHIRLVLINSIPYQASLGSIFDGVIDKELRKKVWDIIGKAVGEEYFEAEIGEYKNKIKKIDLVINATTEDFKKIVTEKLKKLFTKEKIIEWRHPSGWAIPKSKLTNE